MCNRVCVQCGIGTLPPLIFITHTSKLVLVQTAPPSRWFLLALVWKASAKCPSSSVTAGGPATTTLIPIATGWPPWTPTACSGTLLTFVLTCVDACHQECRSLRV